MSMRRLPNLPKHVRGRLGIVFSDPPFAQHASGIDVIVVSFPIAGLYAGTVMMGRNLRMLGLLFRFEVRNTVLLVTLSIYASIQ